MKKIKFILFIVAFFTITVNAQKTSIGFHAGVSFAKYKITVSGISIVSDIKTGFTAGAVFNIPMDKKFSFQTGLDYVQAGGILKANADGNTSKLTTTLNYIELPANFLYNARTKNGKLFVGAGPILDYGISGKFKDETGESSDVHFGNTENDDIKPFNFGINFITGYQFNQGFVLSLNYDLGLSNLSTTNDATYKGHYFGLRIGYFLPEKSKQK